MRNLLNARTSPETDACLDQATWIFMLVLVPGWAVWYSETSLWWVAAALAAIAALVLYAYRRVVWNRIAKRRLGSVFVSMDPSAHAGGELNLFVSCRAPLNGTTFERVNATLVRIDGATRSPEHSHVLSEAVFVPAGEILTCDDTLQLDPGLPPSLEEAPRTNRVRYEIEVEVRIPNWPDWVHAYPVEILPFVPEPVAPVVQASAKRSADQRCPYCHDLVSGLPRNELLQCASCQTILHAECVHEFGRCTTQGCSTNQAQRARHRAR